MPGTRPLRLAAVALLVAALLHLGAPLFGGAVALNLALGLAVLVLAFALAAGLRFVAWAGLPFLAVAAAAAATASDLPPWLAWTIAAADLVAALGLFGALWRGREDLRRA